MLFRPIPTRTDVSELIFSEARTLIDEATLPLLRPVREVVRRYRGVRGRVAGTGDRAIGVESFLELKAARVIVVCSAGAFVLEQPFHLVFIVNGVRTIYTPDFLVIGDDGPVAVEVKPDDHATSEEDIERFQLIEELLQGHGIEFQLWRKSEIEVQPRWKSVLALLPYRRVGIKPEGRGKVRRAIRLTQSCRTICFVAVTAQVVQDVVLRMILDGDLFVDFNEPLTPNAYVSATPFANQLWPVPRQSGEL
jgi:hypothetical protein